MKQVVIFMVAVLVLGGCRTHRETERTERVVRDTVYRTLRSRDTVALRDSIYVKEALRGDTLRITEYRYRTEYRDRRQTDTVRIALRDTVYRDRVREAAAPKPTWWQRVKAQAGGFIAGLVAAAVLAAMAVRRG